MTVQFTPSARLQFPSALAYIRQDNPPAAVRFLDTLFRND
jgi:plasmid stabilization system protein ParE